MGAKAYENPLLKNARLKEMYRVMVEARVLGETMRRGKKRGFTPGLEACWVGSAIGLRDGEGDFASAGAVGSVFDLVLGLRLKAAIRGGRSASRLSGDELNPMERVCFALGAASRMLGQRTVGLVYLSISDLTTAEWKTVLGETLRLELPLVFVAIPAKGDEPGIAEVASKCGVAGIPVDASDAVAMYRVAQESIGRARAGGGPALIEAVRFPAATDPLALLRKQLQARRVATAGWLDSVEMRARARSAG